MHKKDWVPDLSRSKGPQYIAIAEAIAEDISSGRLASGDQLPPQRRVAKALGLDVSAISRGYAEAARRGYTEAHVGKGTFVRDPKKDRVMPDPRRTLEEDPRMNMPPEPDSPELIARMQAGLAHVSANIVPLLRYQTATGSGKDREIALDWMQTNGVVCSPKLLAIAPGSHAAIEAALRVVAGPETVVLCESITYPGIRAIAANLGLKLEGLSEDSDGVLPDALEQAISQYPQAVLYLNPTLRNPTTHSMPEQRRKEIARILERHNSPFIEDDAYRFVTTDGLPPISTLVPQLSWHIAGISKVFGAGLRLAYVQAPDTLKLGAFVQLIRTSQVMTSPVSLALLSTWMEDGTAQALQAFVRDEAQHRQIIAAELLKGQAYQCDPTAYNIWMTLPEGLSRAEVLASMARQSIGIMPSDAFTVRGSPIEAVRVCLGGPMSRTQLRSELSKLREALAGALWSG